jgi:hypothetical protein
MKQSLFSLSLLSMLAVAIMIGIPAGEHDDDDKHDKHDVRSEIIRVI